MRNAVEQQILARTVAPPRESEPPTGPAAGALLSDHGPSRPVRGARQELDYPLLLGQRGPVPDDVGGDALLGGATIVNESEVPALGHVNAGVLAARRSRKGRCCFGCNVARFRLGEKRSIRPVHL